ncbi:MAG: hypothetical protein Tsb0013_11560 [Phycisphaerales bacterium]
MTTFRPMALGLCTLACVCACAPDAHAQRTEIVTNLAPVENGYIGSEGDAELEIRRKRTEFKVEIEDLPDGEYWLYVDGVLRSGIVVTMGEGEVEFSDPPRRGKLPLDFDPDGALIEIVEGEAVILAGLADFAHQVAPQTEFPKQNVKQDLTVVDIDQPSRAQCRIKFKSNPSKAQFEIDAKRLMDGTYTVMVDGQPVATVETRRGRFKERFDTKPRGNKRLLTFDPSGATIELMRGDTLAFTTELMGEGLGDGVDPLGELVAPLTNTGVDLDGSGEAEYRVRPDEAEFEVEIEDVPVGTYDLLLDGLKVGEIEVVDTPDGTEGEIEFSTDTDDLDELPLDFDPIGRTIQVVGSDGLVYFSLVFDGMLTPGDGFDDDDIDDDDDDDDDDLDDDDDSDDD